MEKKNSRASKVSGKGKQRKADAAEDLELADEHAQRVKGGHIVDKMPSSWRKDKW